jgi:hypothetical protein
MQVNRVRVLEKINFQNCRKSVEKPEKNRCSVKKSGLQLSGKHTFVHVHTQGSGEQFALSGTPQGHFKLSVLLAAHVHTWITGSRKTWENIRYWW